MAPDYRSDKMASIEGLSNARGAWFDWLSELPEEQAAFLMRMPNITVHTNLDRSRADEDEHAKPVDVKERSELLGFWIMWHLAGGFRRLEQWGWHRSTIHRKIRRFRDAYAGIHPDEYEFKWIDLNLNKVWNDSAEVYSYIAEEEEQERWYEEQSRRSHEP